MNVVFMKIDFSISKGLEAQIVACLPFICIHLVFG